jgi:hypothetical protein
MPQQGFRILAPYTIKQQRKGIAAQRSSRVISVLIAGPAGIAQSLMSHTINTKKGLKMIKIGDKVRTTPQAWQSVCGSVVAIHPETRQGHVACASVYCGGYESIKVPLSDLVKCEGSK